jgi:uncharacterized protein (UPF0261 family)
MAGKPTILLIATQDSKEQEARFLRTELEAAGCAVIHLDASVRRTVGGAEISPEAVAEAAGMTIEAVRALGHEGKCLEAMMKGALVLALQAHARGKFSGVLGLGGSLGTTLGTAIMRALPYGLPKVMISTMASGFTAPFVGTKDIAMVNAVTDVSGLNSISREVYRNAVLAVAGMAKGYDPSPGKPKPLVLMGTLGTTEKCTRRVREKLEAEGFEVMVFHTLGVGGATLDSIAAEREVAAVLELSWIEIVDRLFGGLAAGGPDRCRAGMSRGIPTILAPGNIDFIVGPTLEQAKALFPGKRYHVHNPALTAVRTEIGELRKIADTFAALAADAKGPVRFFTPLKGFSNHDSPDGHIHEPTLPGPFAEYLRSVLPIQVPLTVIDSHFNDPEFADAIVAATLELTRAEAAA